MKNKRQKRIIFAIPLLLFIVFMWACSEKFLNDDQKYSPDEAPPQGLMEINFEAEVLSYEELSNAKTASPLEQIASMPHALRSSISIQIYEDGTSDWRIEKLTPKHNVSIKDLTPPNTNPVTKVTRINRFGMGYFYDEKGKLLQEHAVPVQSFSDLIIKTKKNPDAIYSAMGMKTIEKLDQYISDVKNKGAIVQDLGNNKISIRSIIAQSMPNARVGGDKKDEYDIEDIIDKNIKMIVGSKMYKKNKKDIVSETTYSYKLSEDKKLLPNAIYAFHYSEDSKGKKHKIVSNTYFDRVSGKINIK
jgi:hypothetical protein